MKLKQRIGSLALVAVLLGWLLKPSLAHADDTVEDDLQNWNVVTLQGTLGANKKVLGYFEVQPRIGGLTDDPKVTTLIIRPALGYQVSKHVSLWQGYGWTPSYQPSYRNEHRMFQQVLMKHQVKNISLTNRTRLEERFIQDAGGTAVRARHQLRLGYPVGKSKRWSLIAYNETFINLNSTDHGPKAGFDQIRFFGGVNRKLNRHMDAEAGYLTNYVNRRNSPDRLNHVILFSLNFNIR